MLPLLCALLACILTEAMVPMKNDDGRSTSRLAFSERWQLLGPFRIGTREAVWGADPLEAYEYGGFDNLKYDLNHTYISPLGINGRVSWTEFNATVSNVESQSKAELIVRFPNVDWIFLQSIYGWAALQYQAWSRGILTVAGPESLQIVLYSDSILEYRIDGKQHVFGGDFYGFRRAPLVLELAVGHHQIDVRLVRDVRAMGGSADATITVTLEAHVTHKSLSVLEGSMIVSDVVERKLPSPLASITVRNDAESWIEILGCGEIDTLSNVRLLAKAPFRIAPGQSRPLNLKIKYTEEGSASLALRINYRIVSPKPVCRYQAFHIMLVQRSLQQPHKMTFLHPSGVVSYAILRPPIVSANQSSDLRLPVLLNLHGAGLEADSHQVRHMLDSMTDVHAWIVFPTGLSPWSGDDWHTWGLADVQASVLAVEQWMQAMEWTGPGFWKNRWLVSGHSNGGQGTWHIVTHQPDKTIAAAPVSGYLSIQNYVPYTMWREASPMLAAMVHNSMSSFRHELLVDNLAEIPILQQHGSADENVPPYHSRLMASLRDELGFPSDYTELADKGHWFEGAMATESLQAFYRKHLTELDVRRTPPSRFTIVIPNSGDMGSCWGFVVDQLESPDHYGRIDVEQDLENMTWHVHTSNIHRFHFNKEDATLLFLKELLLDNENGGFVLKHEVPSVQHFVKLADTTWQQTSNKDWENLAQRYGRQRGALDAIMRTRGSFWVVANNTNMLGLAVQITRNLFQYYGADSGIIEPGGLPQDATGNVIRVAQGPEISPSQLENFPIYINNGQLVLNYSSSATSKRIPIEDGMGAIFLRPLRNEGLELVVWGADEVGLHHAARFLPTLTGVGQPDFIILGNKVRWRGIGGALAMGFFDYQWKISNASYLP